MTFDEFKAWLDGFEEAFHEGAPTAEQYKRLKEKLAEVHIPHGIPLAPQYMPKPLGAIRREEWDKYYRSECKLGNMESAAIQPLHDLQSGGKYDECVRMVNDR